MESAHLCECVLLELRRGSYHYLVNLASGLVHLSILCVTPQRMFHDLAPVIGGFGLKMLKKMGWKEGQALGTKGQGVLEPITLDIKTDRSGRCLSVCELCDWWM